MSKVDYATQSNMEAIMHLQMFYSSSVFNAMQENKLVQRIEVKVSCKQNIAVQRYKKTKKTPQNVELKPT